MRYRVKLDHSNHCYIIVLDASAPWTVGYGSLRGAERHIEWLEEQDRLEAAADLESINHI